MAKGNKKLLILVALVVLWYWYTNNSTAAATPAVRPAYRRAPMMRSRYTTLDAVETAGPMSGVTVGDNTEISTALTNLSGIAGSDNTWKKEILADIKERLGRIPADYANNTSTANPSGLSGAANLATLYQAWSDLVQGTEQMTYDVNNALGLAKLIGTDNVNIQALKNNLNAARATIIADMAATGLRVALPNSSTETIVDNLVDYGGPDPLVNSTDSAYRRRSRYVGMPVSSAGAYGLSGQRMGMSGYSSNMLSGANPFIPKSSTGANTRRGSLYDIRSQPNVMAPGDPLRGYLTNVNPFKQGI
jgi:hypothetical protein